MPDIKANLDAIREKISAAAKKAGRAAEDIKLVAVTKTVPVEMIEQAIMAGILDIGENRVQEAEQKNGRLKGKYPQVVWHMVGHLQRNKVRQALDCFAIIHSVDSLKLAEEIDRALEHKEREQAGKEKIPYPVLLEVNTSGEAAKFGVGPDAALPLLQAISALENIRVMGLMTVAPLVDDAEKARPYFVKLRHLSETINKVDLPSVSMRYLSMGMSHDFEVAIEEGSTMVRIGSAVFGARGI